MKKTAVLAMGALLTACGGGESVEAPVTDAAPGEEPIVAVTALEVNSDKLPTDPIPFAWVNGNATPKVVYPQDCPFLSDAAAMKIDRRAISIQLTDKSGDSCDWSAGRAFGLGISIVDQRNDNPADRRAGFDQDARYEDIDAIGDDAFFYYLTKEQENPVSLYFWSKGKQISIGGLGISGDKDAMITAGREVLSNFDKLSPDADAVRTARIYEYSVCDVFSRDHLRGFLGVGEIADITGGDFAGQKNTECEWRFHQDLPGRSWDEKPSLNIKITFKDKALGEPYGAEKVVEGQKTKMYRAIIDASSAATNVYYLTELGPDASFYLETEHTAIEGIDSVVLPLIENIRSRVDL